MEATPSFRHGAGRVSLDLIRTLLRRNTSQEHDLFAGPPGTVNVQAWAREFGPFAADDVPPPSRSQVASARALREAVYAMVRPVAGGGELSGTAPHDRELINQIAQWPAPVPELGPDGALAWTARNPTSAVLALVARDVLDLVTSPAIGRVRECANPDCAALFLDGSRPGSRRWCSMDTCGNLAKKGRLPARGFETQGV